MQFDTFDIEGPLLITPRVFGDERGYFTETYRTILFNNAAGMDVQFVQDNQSLSRPAGTVRGLHFQSPPHAQGKLVRCTQGAIVDVAVDVRKSSATYGQHIRVELSAQNHRQFWVPPGFLHGFATLEPDTMVIYKCTDYYAHECDGNVLWNDPDLGIDWGVEDAKAMLSDKDKSAPRFADFKSPF